MEPRPRIAADQEAKVEPARGGMSIVALWTLYTLTLRQHLHGKRWMAAAVLFLLPAGLGLFIRHTAPLAPSMWLDFLLGFMFIPQGLLPLVALLYASGMIQDEQEEQTITYLLVRPIPKWALYCVKLLATLTTTVVLTAIFTALTYFTIYFNSQHEQVRALHRCLTAVGTHCLAVSAYCCLFGLISLYTRRTLIVGILYAAIFEGLLANLPLSVRLLTVIYYTRIIAYRTLSFVAPLPRGGTQDIAAEAWRLDILNDPDLLEHPQRATCILVLLIASLAFTILAAFMCSRREFHVKTPEQN
jgi:ABC-2 type transport system permease protein